MRILIVEDDHLQANWLRESLRGSWPQASIPLIQTESAFREQFDDIRAQPPDLMFIDVMLRWTDASPSVTYVDVLSEARGRPQTAGFRCVRLLESAAETSDIPVILYSVLERIDLAHDLLSMPRNVRYLQKTSPPKQMLQFAASLLATRSQLEPMHLVTRDVFICHAREDRADIVDPLVEALEGAGVTIWHDQAEIQWGDSLVGKIEEGLRNSRFVLAVLSKHSVTKPWPQRELNSALSGEISNGVVKVLPLIVGTDAERAEILRTLSLQTDKLYEIWTGDPGTVVSRLKQRLT